MGGMINSFHCGVKRNSGFKNGNSLIEAAGVMKVAVAAGMAKAAAAAGNRWQKWWCDKLQCWLK